MKLAFLVQAHKNKEQLKLLIEYLKKNGADLYLHIDLKAEKLFKELKEIYEKDINVYFVRDRKNVNWSGFSQVEATLEMMKLANKKRYDYISLISGQDLMIKNYKNFVDFLKENEGKQYIEFEDAGVHEWRLKKYSFFRENPKNRTLLYRTLDNVMRRCQPDGIKRKNLIDHNLYFGSQWFTLSGKAIEYILNISENTKIKDEFKYTACPDEHFFQIILLNSHFSKDCINNNLRYIDWHDCKNSPKTLENKDWDRLRMSSKFFARKFDLDVNHEIVKRIYENIED